MQDAEFIAQYDSLVRRIAAQTQGQLGVTCELQDLVSFGFLGLLEARERFEPDRGVLFATFAYYRVRGAIMDGVRSMAYLPRRVHARMRAIATLDSEAERLLAGPRVQSDVSAEASLRAIDTALGRVAAAYCVAHAAEGDEPDSPEQAAAKAERRERVHEALATLDEAERQLVVGHDLDGHSLDALGKQLGMSKSWASRVHGRALDKLRRRLRKL